ncbi:MAG: cytochrome c1, partial [Casimicrobiaceae bacterium]
MLPRLLTTIVAGFLLNTFALASEGPEMTPQHPPVDRHDQASLQRGAKLFVNYCIGCHGAQHMRYNRLARDLGLTEKQVTENLIFRGTLAKDGYVTDKVGETMRTAMDRAEAKEAFGVVPPDLSVESRVRGTDWLYAYLRGYYRDDKTATGWNNLVFPNVAMPNVL